MRNQVQLITYVDRLGGGNIAALQALLTGPLKDLFGGVHLLPFFDPIDGVDAGFDPTDHTQVDPRLGDWSDVSRLSQTLPVMADVIVNHMSSESPQFVDVIRHGRASEHAPLFLTLDKVFPKGTTEEMLLNVYRPRPGLPLSYVVLANGEKRIFWTSFTPKQIDIDVESEAGTRYLDSILNALSQAGVSMVRLDAVGYAIKRPGRDCFMMPETFAFIEQFAARAAARGLEVLVEVHSYFQKQIEIAKQVAWVYDFALPPLLLHAIFNRTPEALVRWIGMRPRNAITVLDTHDGIGIIDIGADASDRTARPGLVSPQALDQLVETIHQNSGGQSREATGAAASNLDLYQVNCTFYDALGRDDNAYLLARAVQFFLPGIPQVYYVGLLAGENDMALLEKTGVGRDINRHHFTNPEIVAALKKPVVLQLIALIKLRNTHPAFAGEFSHRVDGGALTLRWQAGSAFAQLDVDFSALTFSILQS
jgi:sucrose phosphorylase